MADKKLRLDEGDFQIAVGLERNDDKTLLNDPSYICWGAKFYTYVDGVRKVTPIALRLCTEEDMEKFY